MKNKKELLKKRKTLKRKLNKLDEKLNIVEQPINFSHLNDTDCDSEINYKKLYTILKSTILNAVANYSDSKFQYWNNLIKELELEHYADLKEFELYPCPECGNIDCLSCDVQFDDEKSFLVVKCNECGFEGHTKISLEELWDKYIVDLKDSK